ncbi:MAG: putative Ig domain-containing protein [Candidatus Limnocylindrales bacterium]
MPRSFRRSLVITVLLVLSALGTGGGAPAGAAAPDPGTEALPTLSLGQSHACALRTNGTAWCWGSMGDESLPPQETFRVVSASGNLHSCGVITDGTVRCWGDDSDDQSSPTTDRFRDVSAGGRHTCAVRTDGALACWGDDDDGQSTPPEGRFRLVSAGDGHSCALAVDGSVACWGSDRNGQTEAPAGQYIAVSAGFAHSCAIRVDGTAVCWGSDDSDQLDAPTDRLVSVSAGYNHSCGLTPDGRPVCWGHDAYGESTVPQETFLSVAAGYLTTCGVRPDSTVFCWGYETWEAPLAEQPGPVGRWAVASGASHSCAVSNDSLLYCWGANDAGQATPPTGAWRQVSLGEAVSCAVGVDGTTGCWGPAIEGAAPSVPLRQVAVSDAFGCGLAGDGSIACWGNGDAGRTSPPAGAFRAVAVGEAFGCAIAGDGSLACWGANDAGQATPPAGTFLALAAAGRTACAIAADGTLACWGANDAGLATPPAGTFVSVGVGATTACALADSGTAACWGAPLADTAAAPGDTRLTQVSTGLDHACGVVSSGILDCWGADQAGQAQPPIPGAPVATRPVDPQAVAEDAPFELVLPADTFTDDQAMSYTAELDDGSDLPAWLKFNPEVATFGGIPADADVGTRTIAVIATDTEGLTGRTTFPLTVDNTPDAPLTGRQLPEQLLTEDSEWSYAIPDDAFTDDDLDSGDTFTWSVANGDGTTLPGWIRFDAASHTLSGVPARADIGQSSLLVSVTDSQGNLAQSFLVLRIDRVNHQPTVAHAIAEQKAIQDQDFTFTFNRDTFTEPDSDDALVYDATQKGGDPLPPWLNFARSDRTFRGTPRDADVGTLVVTVTASDKAGASTSTDFALRVVNVNDLPALVSRLADQTVVQDQPFVLTLSEDAFTDADMDLGDSLSLRAVGPDGGPLPPWLSFDPATRTFSGIPHDADAGRSVITVVATDSVGEEAAGSFTLAVEDINDTPAVSDPVPDQVAPVNQRFALEIDPAMFLDADVDHGDEFEITVLREDRSALPAWLAFDGETLAFAGTPTDADVGPLPVSVIAVDGQGAEGVDTFVIDVRPESDLPTPAEPSIRKTVVAADGKLPVILDWSSGREANGARPRYRLESRSRGKKGWSKYRTLIGAVARTGTNRSLKPGTYQIRIRNNPSGGTPGEWVESAPFQLRALQESDKSIEYRGSWSKQTRMGALGEQVRRSTRPGDSFRVPVNGTAVSLVMTSGPGMGVIDVCIDPGTPQASCRTIDLSTARKSPRNVVTNLRNLAPGDHVLEVSVRQAPVELDAIAVIAPAPEEPAAPAASPAPAP